MKITEVIIRDHSFEVEYTDQPHVEIRRWFTDKTINGKCERIDITREMEAACFGWAGVEEQIENELNRPFEPEYNQEGQDI